MENGTVVKGLRRAGDLWKSADGCEKCKCEEDGSIRCWNVTCKPLDCDDKVNVTGQCCEKCGFDVGICLVDSTIQVKKQTTVRMTNETRCKCAKGKVRMRLTCYTPDSEQLADEQARINKTILRIERLQKKLYKLRHAFIDIDYP